MLFFFFTNTPPTTIYTLSLHDALPICDGGLRTALVRRRRGHEGPQRQLRLPPLLRRHEVRLPRRSEEHTSELQSHVNLVCRLLLEKKKNNQTIASRRQQQHR